MPPAKDPAKVGAEKMADSDSPAWLTMPPNEAWFKAKQGDKEAQFIMGCCYLYGHTQEQSFKQAASLFTLAANGGHPQAQYHLALLHFAGNGIARQDESQACLLLSKAAASGMHEAMFKLGIAYWEGTGVEQDERRAIQLFKQAAEAGNSEAMYVYAERLEKGDEEHPPELPLAHYWYIKAGETGHALASHMVAILYGQGSKPWDSEGRRKALFHTAPSVVTWCLSAKASKLLGLAYTFSSQPSVVSWNIKPTSQDSTAPDHVKACEWHRIAADRKILQSLYAYGQHCALGLGRTIDMATAHVAFMGASAGHQQSDEGALGDVQWVCPGCGNWMRNEITEKQPKGDQRCSVCREDRIGYKNLMTEALSDDLKRLMRPMTSNKGSRPGTGMDQPWLKVGKPLSLEEEIAAKEEAGKQKSRGGSGEEGTRRGSREGVSRVGSREGVVSRSGSREGGVRPESREGRGSRPGSKATVRMPRVPSKEGSARPATEASVASSVKKSKRLSQKDLSEVVRVSQILYRANPGSMFVLTEVGFWINAVVTNDSYEPTGPFAVEFYVCGADQSLKTDAWRIYGSRVEVSDMYPKTSMLIELPRESRCPLDAPPGSAKLFAVIKPVTLEQEMMMKDPLMVQRAAVKGKRFGMLHLAEMLWRGEDGFEVHAREAIRWYRKKECQGAGNDVATFAQLDINVHLSGPLPLDLAPLTTTNGYKQAWLAVAQTLDAGLPAVVNKPTRWHMEMRGGNNRLLPDVGIAASFLHIAASVGDLPQAQLNLAIWYIQGRHLPKSFQMAWHWLVKASEHGLTEAQYNLGLLYQGDEAVGRDDLEAANLFQQAVDRGHVAAHLSLGVCYLEGKGVPQDLAKAVKLLHVPAKAGNMVAQYNLGCLYSRGLGVEKDGAVSADWYWKAAEQGHMEAQVCFAMCLYRGEGIPRDLERCSHMLRKSGEQGHAQAQYNLGVMYAKGEGVPQNRIQAAEWWLLAANQGHATAQLELGEYHKTLSEEAVQGRLDKMSQLGTWACNSRELFDKFLRVYPKKSIGCLPVKREPAMDIRTIKMLLEHLQLVPMRISQKKAMNVIRRVAHVHGIKEVHVLEWGVFGEALRAVFTKAGIPVGTQTIGADQGWIDPWVRGIAEAKEAREKAKIEKSQKDEWDGLLADANGLLHTVRRTKPPRIWKLDAITAMIKTCEETVVAMREELKRLQSSLNFLIWRDKEAGEKYKEVKKAADELSSKMKMDEANAMHGLAEKYKQNQVKAKGSISKMEKAVENAKRMYQKARDRKQKYEDMLEEKVDGEEKRVMVEDVSYKGELEERRADSELADSEYAIKIRRNAIEASLLFLKAAQGGLAKAQYNLAKVFAGDWPLPSGWTPLDDDELEDKDLHSIATYRAEVVQAEVQMQKSFEETAFKAFSFQHKVDAQIDSKIKEARERQAMHRRREVKMLEATAPQDRTHPASKYLKDLKDLPTGKNRRPNPRLKTLKNVLPQKEVSKVSSKGDSTSGKLKETSKSNSSLGSDEKEGDDTGEKGEEDEEEETDMGEDDNGSEPEDKHGAEFWRWKKYIFRRARASFWFKASAEGGHDGAQYELAQMFKIGHKEGADVASSPHVPFPKDLKLAALWFGKSAESGNPMAQYEYAMCLLEGEGIQQDEELALHWLEASAAQDVSLAYYQLGLCYDQGRGTGVDLEASTRYLTKAAELGYADAQVLLALNLENGAGCNKDPQKAVEWYSKAAQQNTDAVFLLGKCHLDGRGTTQNPILAIEKFMTAAEKGDEKAMLQLGLCYQFGVGCDRDLKAAFHWFVRGGEFGSPEAMMNVGLCYNNGIGCQANNAKAQLWLDRAAAAGVTQAQSIAYLRRDPRLHAKWDLTVD